MDASYVNSTVGMPVQVRSSLGGVNEEKDDEPAPAQMVLSKVAQNASHQKSQSKRVNTHDILKEARSEGQVPRAQAKRNFGQSALGGAARANSHRNSGVNQSLPMHPNAQGNAREGQAEELKSIYGAS